MNFYLYKIYTIIFIIFMFRASPWCKNLYRKGQRVKKNLFSALDYSWRINLFVKSNCNIILWYMRNKFLFYYLVLHIKLQHETWFTWYFVSSLRPVFDQWNSTTIFADRLLHIHSLHFSRNHGEIDNRHCRKKVFSNIN